MKYKKEKVSVMENNLTLIYMIIVLQTKNCKAFFNQSTKTT